MDLRFLETAKAEFWEAVGHYEQERGGLGAEFAREVSKALDRIVCIRIRGVLCRSGRDNVELIDFLMQSSIK